jgi:oligosaccharide repeat unit polymerase
MTARTSVLRQTHVVELRSIFSPLVLVVFLYTPLLLLYVLSSESIFTTELDSRKALSWTGFAYFALALLLFAAGAAAGGAPPRKTLQAHVARTNHDPSPAQRRSLAVLLETALIVSIAAYVLWFGLGFIRAGGVLQFFDLWRQNPLFIKTDTLATVPGATTLAQLAVAAIPLTIAFKLYARGSVIRVLVGLAMALTVARAFLFSERLALLELLIPVAFLVLAPRKVTMPRVVVYALVFLAATMTFFAATELRRSFAYTHDFSAERAATRFAGYYLTSVNNGMAVVDHYAGSTPLYSSGSFLWRFPVVGDLRVEHVPGLGTVSFRYEDAFGVDPEPFWRSAFAEQGLDYEFNVVTAPAYLAEDFGWAGLLAVFVIGLVSGALYRRSATSAFHRAFYAVWLVGLFEFMRILYFSNTRVFPAYLLFAAAYVVLRNRAPQRVPLVHPRTPSSVARSTS